MAKPARSELAAMRSAKSARLTAGMRQAVMSMTGDKLLQITLSNLTDKQLKPALRSGLSASVSVMAKGVRNQVPVQLKQLKKLVGSGVAKQSSKVQGAKVGFSVGRASKAPLGRSMQNVTATGKLKGVGIGPRNIHWAVLGTSRRTVKKTRMYRGGKLVDVSNWNTGAMPPILSDVVRQGVEFKKDEAIKAMEDRLWKKMTEYIEKRYGKK
jgi:hypothetical protein